MYGYEQVAYSFSCCIEYDVVALIVQRLSFWNVLRKNPLALMN